MIQRSRLIATPSVAFEKYEGLGNDFVIIDAENEDAIDAETARRICDRRLGVGADGVLLVLPPREKNHIARMRVVNADGSIAEMCGNGLRCVALHVARSREANGAYETDAGVRACKVEQSEGETIVDVDMGIVRSLGTRTMEIRSGLDPSSSDMTSIEIHVVDAGNPHAVFIRTTDHAIPMFQGLEHIGPQIDKHPSFPDGINVNSAIVDTHAVPPDIHLRVWERGVGLTLACGTGACATVRAGCDTGLLKWAIPTRVHLPGGTLEVTVQESGACRMRGPARHVFSGRFA